MKTIAIRVSDADHKLFSDLATREHMPLSVLVRRLVHAHAVSLALIPDPVAEAKSQLREQSAPKPEPKPTTEPTPKPVTKSPYIPMEYPKPFADLPPVDDVLFDYPEPVDNPPPDDML